MQLRSSFAVASEGGSDDGRIGINSTIDIGSDKEGIQNDVFFSLVSTRRTVIVERNVKDRLRMPFLCPTNVRVVFSCHHRWYDGGKQLEYVVGAVLLQILNPEQKQLNRLFP